MKIAIRKSKLWKLWPMVFKGTNMETTFIAFGDTIYCPHDPPIDLVEHETVHLNQQRHSIFYALIWWWKYYWDLKFRYSQELEAYRRQVEVIYKVNRYSVSRSRMDVWIDRVYLDVARIMASDMYGGMVTEKQAYLDLKRRNGRAA